ncbi:hypothetical protein Ddc_11684 [Ditylenchus destructor]|nr:hypothetical protein Ddc_11684 [Ditylenchus destructor]
MYVRALSVEKTFVQSLFCIKENHSILAGFGASGTVVRKSISADGGFVSANSRPSTARTVVLSGPRKTIHIYIGDAHWSEFDEKK